MLEGRSVSSKMDGVERASVFVRCEDVRSCAIDYAIRRVETRWFVTAEADSRVPSWKQKVGKREVRRNSLTMGSQVMESAQGYSCQALSPLIA